MRWVVFDFIRANWTQLVQHLIHLTDLIDLIHARACTTRVSRQGPNSLGRVYVQSRYCFARARKARRRGDEEARRPRRGSKRYLSRAPAPLLRHPLRGRPTPPARSSRSRWTKEGRRGMRGKEGGLLRPSRLDSSRVTASSAVSQAPSGSIRLPPLRPQLPPPSTAKSNAPTAPAASRPPPFAPTLSPPPREPSLPRRFLLSLWLLPPASARWV